MTLQAIFEHHSDNPLPSSVRGHANAVIAGAIAYDTFCGRKLEWEIAEYEYVRECLTEGLDYIVCEKHKTCATYGSLAKYLSPGLQQALWVYGSLHRPEWCNTYLVPRSKDSEKVHLPVSLKLFNSTYTDLDSADYPTFNLMRKFFHRALHEHTADSEKLKKLLEAVDKHSGKTQDRYYILREPADDVALAKALVKSMLGETVQWPAQATVNENRNQQVLAVIVKKDIPPDNEEDEDDDELYYFEKAEFWGIPRQDECIPLLPIEDDAPQRVHLPEPIMETPKRKFEESDCIVESEVKTARPRILEHLPLAPSCSLEPKAKKSRTWVSPAAHCRMQTALKTWQIEQGLTLQDRPSDTDWYKVLRISD